MKLKYIKRLCAILVVVLAVIISALYLINFLLDDRDITGPTSPDGHIVMISVSDSGVLNFLGDRYVNVTVFTHDGKQVAQWEDPDGQDDHIEVFRLIHSLRWENPNKLVFDTNTSTQSLNIPLDTPAPVRPE